MNQEDPMQSLHDAADDVIKCLIEAYKDERGVHAETLIGAIAAITGENILKVSTPEVEEIKEMWVTSAAANNFFFEEIHGMTILLAIQRAAGLTKNDMPNMKSIVKRTAGAIGGSPFPPLTVPANNYPHEWSPNAAFEHRNAIMKIAESHGLTGRGRVLMLGIATGKIIRFTENVLKKKIAVKLALEIMFGCTKITPLRKRFP